MSVIKRDTEKERKTYIPEITALQIPAVATRTVAPAL